MKKSMIVVVGCSVALTGCQTLEATKREWGTLIGAVGGGLAGALICGDDYKLVCGLVGAGIGGFIGNRVGKNLDKEDKQRLALETSQALAEKPAAASKTREWSNPKTGVKGKVTVKDETTQPVEASIPVLKDRVKVTPPLDLVGETYKVKSALLNVRGGPGADYAKVAPALAQGTDVHVVGRVQSKPDWVMIARDGVGSGYVFAKGLKSTGYAVAATRKPKLPAGAERIAVEAKRQCKTVEQEIVHGDNTKDAESVRMCQQGDGSWVNLIETGSRARLAIAAGKHEELTGAGGGFGARR